MRGEIIDNQLKWAFASLAKKAKDKERHQKKEVDVATKAARTAKAKAALQVGEQNARNTQERIKDLRTRGGILAEPVKIYDYDRFEQDCASFCDAHGIGAIPDQILQNCLRIPTTGFKVQYPNFTKVLYFPVCNERTFDERAQKKLGVYAESNDIVAFVYRDGHTYVAKGLGIVHALQAAGYTEGPIGVPSLSGGKILSAPLRKEWETLAICPA